MFNFINGIALITITEVFQRYGPGPDMCIFLLLEVLKYGNLKGRQIASKEIQLTNSRRLQPQK